MAAHHYWASRQGTSVTTSTCADRGTLCGDFHTNVRAVVMVQRPTATASCHAPPLVMMCLELGSFGFAAPAHYAVGPRLRRPLPAAAAFAQPAALAAASGDGAALR